MSFVRRRFLGPLDSTCARATVLAAALLASGCGRAAYEGPTCVVVCVVDTLRADHTSLLGHFNETTPNLARLGERGTVFESAWSSCSWTLPSMSMLMSGRVRSDNGREVPRSHTLMSERFSIEGYSTYGVSSNALMTEPRGWGRGFDRYEVYVNPDDGRRARGWVADDVVDRAIDFIDGRAADEPFFLFCMLFDPHDPYTPVDGARFEAQRNLDRLSQYRSRLSEDRLELWNEAAYNGIEARIALYDSEVWQADHALGRLFDHLEKSGRAEHTLVVVTSDHGEGLWTRPSLVGEPPKESNFFPPLYMDHGLMLHSEQVHVPLVLAGPGVPVGERVAAPVALLDVAPTVARLVGMPIEPVFDGLDLFTTEHETFLARDIPGFTSRGASLLREGRLRLHVPNETRATRFGAVPELYDLEADPRETQPLRDATLEADMLASLERWIERGRNETRASPITSAERAQLEALGYTAGELDER